MSTTQLASPDTTTGGVLIRRATPADADQCGHICFDAFASIAQTHNFAVDFPNPEFAKGLMANLFADPEIYAVVAESDGVIVGSNALYTGDKVFGIGPITVSPHLQNRTVGRRLMHAVMDYANAANPAGVRLVQAGYHTRSLSLYTKLGFTVREPLVVMQGPQVRREMPGRIVRPASEQDLDACNRLCTSVHGYARSSELRAATLRGGAMVIERHGTITGYTTSIGFFGHAVAETNDDIKDLIAASPVYLGPGFLVPMRNHDLFQWCLRQGLRVGYTLNLMTTGLYTDPAGAYLPSILC